MMRSGRMRSALRTRSRIATSPRPSRFAGRDSSRMRCSWSSWSSAASSMVTMRSSSPMSDDSTLSSVVLPVPVPPLMMMLRRPPTHAEELRSLGRQGAEADEVVDREPGLGELADRERRAVDRERRDDRVDAGAVGEAGVDHRRRLVDAPADRRDDALDDQPEPGLGAEAGVGLVETAAALDVDRVARRSP